MGKAKKATPKASADKAADMKVANKSKSIKRSPAAGAIIAGKRPRKLTQKAQDYKAEVTATKKKAPAKADGAKAAAPKKEKAAGAKRTIRHGHKTRGNDGAKEVGEHLKGIKTDKPHLKRTHTATESMREARDWIKRQNKKEKKTPTPSKGSA